MRDYLVQQQKYELNDELEKQLPLYSIEPRSGIEIDGSTMKVTDLLPIVLRKLSLKDGEKIRIKISGDGRNVGKKKKQILVCFCVLNSKEEVLKPDHQIVVAIIVGTEDYDLLKV